MHPTLSPARRTILVGLVSTVACAAVLTHYERVGAVSTRSFVLDDAETLGAGDLDGTAVHSNGSVTRSVAVRRLPMADVPVAWTLARARDGSTYIGTGNEGRIWRLRGDELAPFAETGQLVVSALATAPDGALYAGTLPEGRIFRVSPRGKATEIAKPEGVEHVWDLEWDRRRKMLLAATGPDGRVLSIDSAGRVETFWDSDAGHVMALAMTKRGDVLAGTSDDALVVRLRGPGNVEVVHDFPGNEITAIDTRDGLIAVAANEFPNPPRVTATKSSKLKKTASPSSPGRKGKGQLWVLEEDGHPDRLFAQDQGHLTSVHIARDGTLWAGSSGEGRLLRVHRDHTHAVWIDVDERQITALGLEGDQPLFLSSDAAAVYRVQANAAENATWTSKVLDAHHTARFGQLDWRATGPLVFQTRSGNREEPDATWSGWSSPLSTPGPIRSPAGRFLQVRARFPATSRASLLAVQAFYLPQNQRPQVHSVQFKTTSARTSGSAKNKRNRSHRDRPPAPSSKYKLQWKVTNPDDDELRYRLRFRAEGQSRWRKILRESDRLTEVEYEWETSGLPDGYYVVQVEASDELSNPRGRALRALAESEPLLIDNHPPEVTQLRVEARRLKGRASDGLGPVARLELAIDGGEWRDIHPADSLLDTAREDFDVELGSLAKGEHIVAVRATDAGGNTGAAETLVQVN